MLSVACLFEGVRRELMQIGKGSIDRLIQSRAWLSVPFLDGWTDGYACLCWRVVERGPRRKH